MLFSKCQCYLLINDIDLCRSTVTVVIYCSKIRGECRVSGRTEGNLESVEERDGTARTGEERIVEGRDGVRCCNNEDKRQVKVRDERWRKE